MVGLHGSFVHRTVFGAVVAIVGSTYAEGLRPAHRYEQGTETGVSRTGSSEPTTPETAESLLRALRRARPIQNVVPPESVRGQSGQSLQSVLLPEGHSVIDRSGFLTKDGRWWVFGSDSTADEPVVKLLPNENLEVMVRTTTGSAGPVGLTISGEMTVFHGENYLLVRFVHRTPPESRVPHEAPSREDRDEPAADATATARRDGQAGGSDPGPTPSTTVSPEEVISALKNRGPREVILTPPTPRLQPSIGRDLSASALLMDGSALIRRPGRIVRDGDWWTLVFESDRPDYAEAPQKLLPSRGVEMMLQTTEHGRSGIVFIVSGEVTRFKNANFLLPRAVVRRTENGNLRK